jgi:hypothetical protein
MYDTETTARHIKAGVARMWANLTTSVAAKAYETRYRAAAAKMASDRADKAQRMAREGKPEVRPPSDEGSPLAADATSRLSHERAE